MTQTAEKPCYNLVTFIGNIGWRGRRAVRTRSRYL